MSKHMPYSTLYITWIIEKYEKIVCHPHRYVRMCCDTCLKRICRAGWEYVFLLIEKLNGITRAHLVPPTFCSLPIRKLIPNYCPCRLSDIQVHCLWPITHGGVHPLDWTICSLEVCGLQRFMLVRHRVLDSRGASILCGCLRLTSGCAPSLQT